MRASAPHSARPFLQETISDPGLFAQVVRVRAGSVTMAVEHSTEALDIDFRTESVRPDVPGTPRARPGFHLASWLDRARADGRECLAFNGNNLGYWGNQFVLRPGGLVFKEKPPLFPDRRTVADLLQGWFTFFYWSPQGFGIDRFGMHGFVTHQGRVEALTTPSRLPAVGLSGYPLLFDGYEVWQDSMHEAWDPRLLFDVGRYTGVEQLELLDEIDERRRANEPLLRHPLTAVGVDTDGTAIVMVCELSQRSRGLSVREAALLMRELGAVRAIALGAAGDAQLGSTADGLLTSPLVSDYAKPHSVEVSRRLRSRHLSGTPTAARPVPSLVVLDFTGVTPTESFPAVSTVGRHGNASRQGTGHLNRV